LTRDLDRFLAKQSGGEGREVSPETIDFWAAVLKHGDLIPLHDRETGEAADRFTTRPVRAEEWAALADADKMGRIRSRGVSGRAARSARAGRTLRPDQDAAFAHAIGPGDLKLVEGRAGTGADVEFDTKHGKAGFAIGDQVQFTDTDKRRHIYNGNASTITKLDGFTGEIAARLDAAGGAGREVTWLAGDFEGFRHGYAGTIYKGQGKTLDRTYLYHTEHWRAAASYVALTRQRDSAQVFVARETARDANHLARQMARGEVRAASVAWATPEEAAKERTARQPDPATADRTAERIQAG
jgi:hypothetical protein